METDWSKLLSCPGEEAIATLRRSWAWFLPEQWTPVLFSIFGNVFFERQLEGVFWLNTGTGELTQVARNIASFQEALRTELADEWFMPSLVEKLHKIGKIPYRGQCYTYNFFPFSPRAHTMLET